MSLLKSKKESIEYKESNDLFLKEVRKLSPEITKTIVHGGDAHMDDTMAIILISALYPEIPIERRDPSLEELISPKVLKIEVGGEYDPKKLQFDHHKGNINECALSLFLKSLGIWDRCVEALPSLNFIRINDLHGIQGINRKYKLKLNKSKLREFQPFNDIIIHALSNKVRLYPTDPLFNTLNYLGIELFRTVERYEKCLLDVRNNIRVLWFAGIPVTIYVAKKSSIYVNAIINQFRVKNRIKNGLSITLSNRNEDALKIYKYPNERRLNLVKLFKHGYNVLYFQEKSACFAEIRTPKDINLMRFIQNLVENLLENPDIK